jgi:hypothetical protein
MPQKARTQVVRMGPFMPELRYDYDYGYSVAVLRLFRRCRAHAGHAIGRESLER